MTQVGSVHASMSATESPEASNDALIDGLLPAVPRRNSPANDNPGDQRVLSCLPVTDEEVTLLHRYLCRDILGLFS